MDLPLLPVCSPTSTLLYPTKPLCSGWCAASSIMLLKTSSNLLVPSSSQLCSATTSLQCAARLYPSLATCSVQPTECDNRCAQKSPQTWSLNWPWITSLRITYSEIYLWDPGTIYCLPLLINWTSWLQLVAGTSTEHST